MEDTPQLAIRQLVTQLASPDSAEDAQHALQTYGIAAIPDVLDVLPNLDTFGQLCAIEIIESCNQAQLRTITDPSVAECLILLLASDSTIVREWSALTLGWLAAHEAIPMLVQAEQRAKATQIPPDWGERVAYRGALTVLGVRQARIPPSVQRLALSIAPFSLCWAAADVAQVIKDLAAARQIVLYFQVWQRENDTLYRRSTWDNETEFDDRWDRALERSYVATMEAVRNLNWDNNTIVTIEWIDESDL